MAGVALQPLLQVFLVIEGNRLPGFEALAEGDEEGEQNYSDRNSDEEEFHLVRSPNCLCPVLNGHEAMLDLSSNRRVDLR